MTTAIEVVDGNISLGGRPIVRGVDLTVRRGEVVALLGSNGSGKSTLVRGLMGLVAWSSGDVRLLGNDRAAFRDWHRVGYVPQHISAGSGIPATVLEVVSSGRLSRRRLLLPLSRHDRDAVQAALRAVELDDRQHDAVSQLSGGQQQRVLIARALAGEPDLLVLDEPNAGVDMHNQIGLVATLRPMVESGATVLLVLHETGPLADLIDRVVVLSDGRVTYEGPAEGTPQDDVHDHHLSRQQHDRTPLAGDGPL